MSDQREDHPQPVWRLSRRDQTTIAGLALAAIVCSAIAWLVFVGPGGKLVEVDRQPRRSAAFVVDLNRASWPELAQLPGIGETLARRIVASRETDGAFTSFEALGRVSGLGPKKLEKIKPFLAPIVPGKEPGSTIATAPDKEATPQQ